MKKFLELEKGMASDVEKAIAKKWSQENILQKTIDHREGCENFVFYDGPATANGLPGVHHMLAKFLKDSFCKYKTMKGYRVLRKVGWDTHGLPVELQVEKQLGFHSKTDIEAYGIEPFNKKCKESVWVNEEAFARLTKEMGQFIDLDHPYVTYDNNYIETEWWILKKFFEEGMFYEGHKILPYCTRCGTGLASHEVAQGYKEVSVTTVTVPMKLVDEDAYLLVWTTTPWTLISNVAVAVNPKEEYVKALSQGNQFIVAKKLANKVLGEDYQVLETYKGTDLEYKEYEQLMPFLDVKKKAFFVTCADYVTMEDGTGIVHQAPAFGQDDYEVGRKYNLPVLNPVGEDGKYVEGPWKDLFVMDADKEIILWLKEQGKLFKKETIKHNYPHCWRCGTPLLYYSKPSYYLEVTKIKDQIIQNNKQVHWHPDYVGEKRFGNWLENLNDWAISRSRYWGTPLPYWICETCGHDEMIGSREELCRKATVELDPKTVELHRPFVDEIELTCPECSGHMHRVTDVIDCWFDSGSMPYAQYHYPFENQELFDSQFPADFICEGIDQTRGWFYTLMVLSTFVKGVSPYKNVLVNDLLLDKYGKKMSKSKGNTINPFDLIEKYGADTVRFYLPYVSPVWTPIKFDEDGLKEVHSKFFNTLRNTYNFFVIYANTDEIDPRCFEVPYEQRALIDQWLLSKYQKLVRDVTEYFEAYDLTKVVRALTEFVNEDLSNWYIRRNRRRFWKSELDTDKKAVYKTTYDVLVGLTKLIAPILPFLPEEMYQKLTGEESVHLADYPEADLSLIDEAIEERMDLVRNLISLGRFAREEVKIKVRQPIAEVLVDGKNKEIIGDLVSVIEEELNVKTVTFATDLADYMNFKVVPNFKVAGPVFGKEMKRFSAVLNQLTVDEIQALRRKEEVVKDDLTITSDLVEIRVEAKEGFNVAMENNLFIILNTTLSDELIKEGLSRELISKIQNLRKQEDFEVTDHIVVSYSGTLEIETELKNYIGTIQKETLCDKIERKEDLTNIYQINDYEVGLSVEKVSA